MIRSIDSGLYLYLCQCADWQIVVEAEDDELAATLAIEKIMTASEKKNIAAFILVKKMDNDVLFPSLEDVKPFYCPLILANAGFHSEAVKLEDFIKQMEKENGKK